MGRGCWAALERWAVVGERWCRRVGWISENSALVLSSDRSSGSLEYCSPVSSVLAPSPAPRLPKLQPSGAFSCLELQPAQLPVSASCSLSLDNISYALLTCGFVSPALFLESSRVSGSWFTPVNSVEFSDYGPEAV